MHPVSVRRRLLLVLLAVHCSGFHAVEGRFTNHTTTINSSGDPANRYRAAVGASSSHNLIQRSHRQNVVEARRYGGERQVPWGREFNGTLYHIEYMHSMMLYKCNSVVEFSWCM